ncbi:MAG: topology modulation protein [Phycisphaerales bacterium]|nr:topology modulation protein [Phycisphaerales bacterium]
MQRIVVVGTSGSGKTTLARELSARLRVPHIELDELYWEPNWTEAEAAVFRSRVESAVAGDRWVCDGNYSVVRDLVWRRADAIVWLDYPIGLVFRRAFVRTMHRCITRQPLWGHSIETLRKAFLSNDSILLWVISTWRLHRRNYPKLLATGRFRHLRVHRFRTPGQTKAWLDGLQRDDAATPAPAAIAKIPIGSIP